MSRRRLRARTARTALSSGCAAAIARLLAGAASSALLVALTLAFALPTSAARAQDATWLGLSADFNNGRNWSTGMVPTGTASFTAFGLPNLSFSANTTIGGWSFNPVSWPYSFTNAYSLQFTGAGIVINGGSATINNNLGTLIFSNSSTAGSALINNNGVLIFANSSTGGNSIIVNNIFLDFYDTSTAGDAVIILNNYNNSPNTSQARLAFHQASSAGSARIINWFSGSLNFYDTSTAGRAYIENHGSVSFYGTSTAGNANITNILLDGGSLNFYDTSTAGSATITNYPGGSLNFYDTSTAGNASIENQDNLAFHNSSTAGSAKIVSKNLVFYDASTAGSATIKNGNRLSFYNNSTAGSANIANFNGVISFFDTSSAGSARFIFNGGALDISGLTTGGTTAGSIEGNSRVLLGSKNLTVGGNNLSTEFSGAIQDGGIGGGTGGSLTKAGSGTLTLSGSNTYSGATTVDAGTLNVTGTVANSPFTVNGGTLAGTGTVGNVTVANGGTFAPGPLGTPGAITVAGNLAFQPGALYLVQTAATASLANVSGSATLSGGSVQASGLFEKDSYNILHATGGLGGTTFSGLIINDPNYRGSLSYTPTDAFLNLQLDLITTLEAGGFQGNADSVANAIDNFFNDGGTLPASFASMFDLTGANLDNALSELSGEAATGGQQGAFQLTNQFLGIMLDPFVDGRGGIGGGPALSFAPEREGLPQDVALAYAKAMRAPADQAAPLSFEQRWGMWAAGYGGYSKTSGDPIVGSHDLTARTFGGAAGLDYHFSPDTVAGFAFAGGGTNWGLAQGLGGGKSDAFQAGAYAATRWGPAYLAGAFGFTNHWMSTDRFADFGDHLTASFNAESFGGRLEGGYRFGMAAVGMTPYAALQAQSFHTPSYSETDVNGVGFALNYDAHTASDTRSELGSRFDYLAAANADMILTLRGRLAWAHDWISDPSLMAVFQALPGASFIVDGAAPAKDSALATVGAELRLSNGVSLLAKFDGEFANHSQTYAGMGSVRYVW